MLAISLRCNIKDKITCLNKIFFYSCKKGYEVTERKRQEGWKRELLLLLLLLLRNAFGSSVEAALHERLARQNLAGASTVMCPSESAS